MKATIKDIAKVAGISYSSVSRALNGLKGVSEETRQQVRKIAEEMEYTPNAVARGLVQKQTGTLGLIIPDITNPFYPELARGVEERASAAGYNTFFCNTNYDLKKEESYIQNLLEKRVDGIILAPISGQSNILEQRKRMPVPCVYLGNAPENTKYSFVITDNIRGGYLAARTLIEKDYHRIGFISGINSGYTNDGRYLGFAEAMKRYDLELNLNYVRQETWRLKSGYENICKMIDSGDYPEAVIAGNDLIAMGILQGIKEKGLRVPEDIAIIGFDDIPNASWPEINLTTIKQPKIRMGEAAVEVLLELFQEESSDKTHQRARRIILDPELILRGTC
ncbi:MAG: LacI family DNA-binding transcriptional regulator [Bacteroidetes bacterium]|nr:LacI family DNA-binding transcriptional regulator [Bacteroidota bacterium]